MSQPGAPAVRCALTPAQAPLRTPLILMPSFSAGAKRYLTSLSRTKPPKPATVTVVSACADGDVPINAAARASPAQAGAFRGILIVYLLLQGKSTTEPLAATLVCRRRSVRGFGAAHRPYLLAFPGAGALRCCWANCARIGLAGRRLSHAPLRQKRGISASPSHAGSASLC